MCAQTRPQFILSSERVLGGMESELMIKIVGTRGKKKRTPREIYFQPAKFSSEENQTHDSASNSTASPTQYQLSCPDPILTE